MEDDLYAVLGVLPEAEPAVIAAAYRVLAAKYHPDKWSGEPSVAHEQMVLLNRAYDVLRDPVKRKQYDEQRSQAKETRASFEQSEEQSSAFDQGMQEVEERWDVATSVLPELEPLRKRLAKTSYQLAFAFVFTLLETRRFAEASKLAEVMEASFLRRYFGTDPRIIDFAKELIRLGQRGAIKTLNRLVDILGSDVEAERIILKVVKEFKIDDLRQQTADDEEQRRLKRLRRDRVQLLQSKLDREPWVEHAKELIELFGLKLVFEGGGYFRDAIYVVKEPASGATLKKLPSGPDFVLWAKAQFGAKEHAS